MPRCIERCHLPCCLSRVHIEEARLGVGIELLVAREVGQTRLLPLLVTILGTIAIVRDEGEKESAKRTAYSGQGLHTELRPRRDVTAALPARRPLPKSQMSEIDKIFAAKGKPSLADPQPSISPSKRKRKHKGNRPQSDTPGNDPPSDRTKRPEPETVIDPSFDINPKRPKVDRAPKAKLKRPSDKDDEKTFKDSRGSTGRKSLLSWLSPSIQHAQGERRRKVG